MYTWLIFIHVLGVMGFLFFHGVSAGVAFALRRERNLERIRALLNLSSNTIGGFYGSFLLLLVSGVINGFIGNWWGKGWIWVSLLLLIAVFVYMYAAGSRYYSLVRKSVGLNYMVGAKMQPPEEPAGSLEIDALLSSSRPMQLAGVGMLSLAIIAGLMIFKPF